MLYLGLTLISNGRALIDALKPGKDKAPAKPAAAGSQDAGKAPAPARLPRTR